MKRQVKHLSLSKETLHHLAGRELSKVAGQTVGNSCAACSATLACTNCSVCDSCAAC